jgi:hypothetical protein
VKEHYVISEMLYIKQLKYYVVCEAIPGPYTEDKPTQTSVRAHYQASDSSWFPQFLQASVYFKTLSQLEGLCNIKLENYCEL